MSDVSWGRPSLDGMVLTWIRRTGAAGNDAQYQLETLDLRTFGTAGPRAIGPRVQAREGTSIFWSSDGTWLLMIVPASGFRVEPFQTYFGI